MSIKTAGRAPVAFSSLVLCLFLFPARRNINYAQGPVVSGKHDPSPPKTAPSIQRVYAALPVGYFRDADLVLNNNSPQVTEIRSTLFSQETASEGPSVALQA